MYRFLIILRTGTEAESWNVCTPRKEMFETFAWVIVILTAALYTDIALRPLQILHYTHEESLCGWV